MFFFHLRFLPRKGKLHICKYLYDQQYYNDRNYIADTIFLDLFTTI